MKNLVELFPRILNHPWYQKWECGHLPLSSLQTYAAQYYAQVENFPRYLSRLHSETPSLETRRILLENLNDEENPASPHPELWLDFAEGLGLDREAVKRQPLTDASRKLVDTFKDLTARGPASGLGALMAYEGQVPAVAKFKKAALETHYLGSRSADERAKATRFFSVHEQADVWHTAQLERAFEALPDGEKQKAQAAASEACQALWGFLDAMPH